LSAFPGYLHNVNFGVLTDLDGNIVHFNKTAQVFFQKPVSEVAGTPITEYLHEDDRDTLQHALSLDKVLQPYVVHGLKLEGLDDPVLLRYFRHKARGFCLIFLESLQITEEVLVAREEHKWVERLQLMLFGIYHELKTPLAVARGYAEVLQNQEEDGDTSDRVMEALDQIASILNNMTEPIRELSEDQSLIDLGQSIEMYMRTMSYTEPTKRYIGHFEAEIEAGTDKKIRMSKPRFYQTLTNLFENAIRATDEKGTDASIRITTRMCEKPHHPNCVVMEFEDNGVGMKEETAQRVFTPYFTTRGPDTGTGLGGYFIYQFVMDAGGSIDVYTEPGEGTMFALHLPYVT
jgi:signal transduction histidine kinase